MMRRGILLWEMLAACVLLGTMTTVSLQFLQTAALQRRASSQRLVAVQEAANVLERLCARPWDELTAAAGRDVTLSPQADRCLRGGAVDVQIDGPSGTPSAKRIVVAVRWGQAENRPALSVRLVAWRYKP